MDPQFELIISKFKMQSEPLEFYQKIKQCLLDYSSLAQGAQQEQLVHQRLEELRIIEVLKAYKPLVVGTFPIACSTLKSDVDIICYAQDPSQFVKEFQGIIKHHQPFSLLEEVQYLQPSEERSSSLIRFSYKQLPFEIFCDCIDSKSQNGFRHMLIEKILLELFPESREPIVAMKLAGIKTEPAFARYFKLVPSNQDSHSYLRLLSLLEELEGLLAQL